MQYRLRASLYARMAVAVGVLCSVTLVLSLVLAFIGAGLGFALFGWVGRGAEALLELPRLSSVLGGRPLVVAAASVLYLYAVFQGWPYVRAHTDETYLLPPTTPVTAATTVVALGALYLVVAEGAAVLVAVVPTLAGLSVAVAVGIALSAWVTVGGARRRLRELRAAAIDDSAPGAERAPDAEAALRRLAAQAGVPAPEFRVTETDRPESLTVGAGEEAVVVVSSGLLESLDGEQVAAVLAHEVAHLANGDSRVMGAALGPVLATEQWTDDPDGLGDRMWHAGFTGLKRYAQFGAAVLSRGRERSADVAAAELTGSPAALATALERLDGVRRRPAADRRRWEREAAILDVLPPTDREAATGPFRTHPPTEDRVEYLKSMAESAETAGRDATSACR